MYPYASFSGLSIFDFPSAFSNVYLLSDGPVESSMLIGQQWLFKNQWMEKT
jgi:hypothetical protein